MYKRILATLLTISCLSRSAVVYAQTCDTPLDLYKLGCKCYGSEQIKKLASAVTDFKLCQIDLTAKNALVKDRLVEDKSATPELGWWQTLQALVGGVVVSLSFGALLVFLVKK